MNLFIKTFSIFIFTAFLLSACIRNSTSISYLQKEYEEATALQQKGNLNDAIFHYQLVAISCLTLEDSLMYWWKAMYEQGKIWKCKNYIEDARRDFETVLYFAQKKRLDTVIYMVCRPLTLIYIESGRPKEAYAHALLAQNIASEKKIPYTLTQGQNEEAVIAYSAYALHTQQKISEETRKKLSEIAESSNKQHRIMALGILTLYKERISETNPYLIPYIENYNQYCKAEFKHLTNETEREKKQLIAERDNFAEKERNVLFISLTILSLLVCSYIFIFLIYRNKYELDKIRLILKQKEETIQYLEVQKGNNEALRLQIKKKKKEWVIQEQKLRKLHLYDMEIGKKIPSTDNPHNPQIKDYARLMSDAGRQMQFLTEMDYCFNKFATGLQKLVPDLTIEETVYCCLFHLNIRTSDIAEMFSRSKSTISSRRKRLEIKIKYKS